MDTLIAYDLGTGGNKASLYDAAGRLLAAEFVPYATAYPQAGWHEQRPEAWWDSVVESTRRLLAGGASIRNTIRGLAISGHSLGCVPIDRDGRLLRESTPIWSDSRPLEQVVKFFSQVDPGQWYRTTGNGFPPQHYTVFKILWYRDHEPEMFCRIDKVIGTKDYVNFRLTGRVATDYSYASGCGVYDLLGGKYSSELLAAADLSPDLLPEIVPSTTVLGQLTGEAAETLGLPRAIASGLRRSRQLLHGPGHAVLSRGKDLRLARIVDVDRQFVRHAAAGRAEQALCLHACGPRHVCLGLGDFLRRDFAALGARSPVRQSGRTSAAVKAAILTT